MKAAGSAPVPRHLRLARQMALGVCLGFLAMGVLADFLASEHPIVLWFGGELYLFPNLISYPSLRVYDARLLEQALGAGDVAVFPCVPFGYDTHDLSAILAPPSGEHWLGTDGSGRDVLARVIHGTRVSLAVGGLSALVCLLVGVSVGTVAGYFGGWADALLMRWVDLIHSIPVTLLLVTLLAMHMPTGATAVLAMALIIGLVRWPDVARLVRSEVLRLRSLPYLEAARASGSGFLRLFIGHLLPNALGPILVAGTFAFSSAIVLEGSLSFLGFGIPDDLASWGGLLTEVRGSVEAWWLAVYPGAALFLSVAAINVLGEALTDKAAV